MAAALALGARGMGQVWPNPAVGCLIVRDGRIVGRGRTAPGGRPHAEPIALAQAGEAARGATAYVSLEPCSHHGVTPPCAEALIAAGVARVVIPLEDVNPKVAGDGIARLEAAGIAVTAGVLAEAAGRDHRGFFLRMREGRPMVTLKLASSFDGRIATATGESRWITGPQARRRVHAERLRHDMVLVGGGTARADDPDLSVREMGAVRQPVRAVVSRHLNVPLDGRLIGSAAAGPVWALVDASPGAVNEDARAAWEGQGGRLIGTEAGPGGNLEPRALLQTLGREGITRVFCEGGGALAASLLAADLVDEILGFTAGLTLGAEGQPSLGAMGIDSLAGAPRYRLREVSRVGEDVLHRWERRGA
ncbi:bifunctional diaminohydroxyphosphoribosylaminopyrimidine deaminase/5-amino-6-(5-phosphoribosylamino)uracil reductase RibD [Ovoidimarina sediminis]|uniref:bifunctional diaminohydroxyphosphoribosylaminopyrimidine deaminase/5-amino-6-(5-phosphoribosylamino)uracil reductase RibD n=1 Tax=Ovoidimarina sediminis TaxID=3079856 RepID=UPI002914C583|nr:bifunctional diaminohydroxyphosphoribosylaminopyrimidine deaminase/5-amino-6-(5-phosphoribosylamino)uracil reductase RibD [Rhodophyticola sp. MJ-SS7]MDU8943393.1 bifunctional diaminohydroxyphosphoribosylaminopyrimidine deaminase/5-amino-6-(5-phosphoribosylamino)uracil reductase RibD [Rhodophyticola sp. MJ-SS7]